MQVLPKTIQIFLPDGNARSIRIAEITSRTVQAIQIPRSKLKEAGDRYEVRGVGAYFLLGESDEGSKPLVYIGEAEDCYKRLNQHNLNKDFWKTAVVFVSRTQSFTKAHGKYLEWFCYNEAKKAERYKLENVTAPTEPFISEAMRADLLDNFETIRVLLSTLGFPLFDPIRKPASSRRILYCKGKDAYAEGEYMEDGFVVFKGSKANLQETNSAGPWVANIRDRLKKEGVIVQDGGIYRFTEDHLFSSPSAAAAAVVARTANGWRAWRDNQNRTLDELERQPSKAGGNHGA